MQKLPITSLSLILVALAPASASAHSAELSYNLPIPFWMYLSGGAATVALSFVVIGYFFSAVRRATEHPRISLTRFWLIRACMGPRAVALTRLASVLLLVLTIVAGLVGTHSSTANFNMTFFWIVFVLGVTYSTLILGDYFRVINPWRVLTDRLGAQGIYTYPTWLGYYPALIFYFLFIWFELFGKVDPHTLSVLLTLYTALTYVGVIMFGRAAWFTHGEFLSVFFTLVGKVAPIEYRAGNIYLRPFGAALRTTAADHVSLLLFVLFMLASTAYDGIKETLSFVRFYWQSVDPLIRPAFGAVSYPLFETFALAFTLLVFFLVYTSLVATAKIIARSTRPLKEIILLFAFSLVPLALAYHLAHYYTLVFTEGPHIVRLISDPFGFGWDLFGTVRYYPTVVLNTSFVWHSQVLCILAGHVVGVYLAHATALRVFVASRARVLVSQLPMLVLMIIYTMIGLFILAQPIMGETI